MSVDCSPQGCKRCFNEYEFLGKKNVKQGGACLLALWWAYMAP